MKKLGIFLLMVATASTTLPAQSKLSLTALHSLQQIRQERALTPEALKQKRLNENRSDFTPAPDVIAVMAVLNDGYSASDIEGAGYNVTTDLNSVLVVEVPVDSVETLSELTAVKVIDFGRTYRHHNNYARNDMGVNALHTLTANNQDMPLTGKGVVTGIYDAGVMPNHINFTNEDGTTRIKRLWYYSEGSLAQELTTDEQIKNFTTDDVSETHGTHTLGTMAGGYKGEFNCAETKDHDNSTVDPSSCHFYGMAPEGEIVVGCGDFSDTSIASGIGKIVDYANNEGKPVVINLSLGSLGGPHDGTDVVCQALTEAANKGAVVCVSAGNDGANQCSIECKKETKTFLMPESNKLQGYLEMWASNSNTFTVQLIDYNTSTRTETILRNLPIATSGYTITASDISALSAGNFYYFSGIDYNNRFTFYSTINAIPLSGHILGIKIIPGYGQTVDVWYTAANYGYLDSNNVSGYTKGTPDNSINNLATAENVISVGAHTPRTRWSCIDGYYRYYSNYTKDDIAYFSSYGHAFNGEQLPHVTAPGNVVSSYSTYYFTNNSSNDINTMTAYVRKDNVYHLWGDMQGTSMACPAFAGTMALWLQADPTLTTSDIKDVLNKTSTTDSFTALSPARFGAGKVNAFNGVKTILAAKNITGTGNTLADPTEDVLITTSPTAIEIVCGVGGSFSATLHSLTGMEVASVKSSTSEALIDTQNLTPGIYVLTIDSAAGRFSRKIHL